MGLNDRTASSIYGLYTAFVYLAALPGGWIADRLIGSASGLDRRFDYRCGAFHFSHPINQSVFLGSNFGRYWNWVSKPNISAIVGQLYPEGGARRDAGFTIFYMGINMGAFLGPLICSYLGEQVNWHLGFGVAGIGMLFGVAQYKLSAARLGDAGLHAVKSEEQLNAAGFDKAWYLVIAGFAVVGTIVILGWRVDNL